MLAATTESNGEIQINSTVSTTTTTAAPATTPIITTTKSRTAVATEIELETALVHTVNRKNSNSNITTCEEVPNSHCNKSGNSSSSSNNGNCSNNSGGSSKKKRSKTITSDPGILCFHHCNVKVFCFTLPHICPNCKTSLHGHHASNHNIHSNRNNIANNTNTRKTAITRDSLRNGNFNVIHINDNDNNELNCQQMLKAADDDNDRVIVHEAKQNVYIDKHSECFRNDISLKLLPFRLPYPFVRATQYPCAILLRPTTGDFLNDYNNATDLHIAVTTSTGSIVEFDRYGLQRHRTNLADNMPEWWQCLLIGDVSEPWYDYWDDILMQICKQSELWSINHYDEDTHNCYTFVLEFLKALGYDKLSEAAHSKTEFCEKYIVPKTTTAGKYISLYRKLRDVGIYVHHQQQQQHQKQQSQHQYKQRNNEKIQPMHSRCTNEAVCSTTAAPTMSPTNSTTSTGCLLPAYGINGMRIMAKPRLKTTSFSITTRTSTLCTIEE